MAAIRKIRRLALGVILAGVASVTLGSSAAGAVPVPAVAPTCSEHAFSQPFLRWLDPAYYTLAPGGTFEHGTEGWALGHGAKVTRGNESFHVAGQSDRRSLWIPAGSHATTPPICVSAGYPTLRFFAKGSDWRSAPLAVDVLFEDALGNRHSTPLGIVTGGKRWRPTLPIAFFAGASGLVSPDGTVSVAFRFRPTGSSGWRIDDVYVDPFKGR